MAGGTGALLDEAQRALQAGEWSAAKRGFESVLEGEEAGAAWFGLGVALWWLTETEAALRSWERAYVVFRHGGEPQWAVLAAVYLCLSYRMSLGNDAAANGWLGRAMTLVEEEQVSEMSGWVLLGRAYLATDSGRPQAGEAWAREARELARTAADADLELCALSEIGAALVGLGKLEEGLSLLDEAMAGALAGESDLDAVVMISCRTITSCSRAGDLRRATQWVHAADGFYERHGSPHLYMTCRTHYGGILLATGEWERAESELKAALHIGKTAEPALHAEALAKLAELRLAQGRLDESLRLLDGYEDHPAAAYPRAALHLAHAEPARAAAVLRRRLAQMDDGCLEAAALEELLADVELGGGDLAKAASRAEQLADLGAGLGCIPIQARGQRALGRVLVLQGEHARATQHLERALASFRHLEMPLEVARTQLLIATALAEGQAGDAIAEGQAALAGFEALGAARDADAAAALLRSLGATAPRGGAKGVGGLTKRELEVLVLLGEGLSNPELAARLFITRKTVEHHVASVLAKLGLRNRGEAAAYAVRHLERSAST